MSEVKTLATTTRWFVGQWEAQNPSQQGWHTAVEGLSTDTPEGVELIDRTHYDTLELKVQQRLDEAEKLFKETESWMDTQSYVEPGSIWGDLHERVKAFLASPGCADGEKKQ